MQMVAKIYKMWNKIMQILDQIRILWFRRTFFRITFFP